MSSGVKQAVGRATDLPCIGNKEVPEGHPAPLNDVLWEPKPRAVSVFAIRCQVTSGSCTKGTKTHANQSDGPRDGRRGVSGQIRAQYSRRHTV